MKRAMALLLAVLVSLLAGCTREVPQTTKEAPTTQTAVPKPTPGYVTEPVAIEFWYNYSYVSGQNELLLEQVARFNEINPYGITVKAVEHSDYTAIYDSLSKGKPDLVCDTMYTTVQMDADGRIADMADYVRRDGWDLENFPASLRSYMQHYEDKVICFPYNVSTYVLYYNKAYCPEPPESLEQWVEMARKITEENPKVHGMYLPISFTTLQRPILESLGACGVVNEGGDGPGDNLFGALQTFCTDWLNWMEEGFCSPISTNADDHMIAFLPVTVQPIPPAAADLRMHRRTAVITGRNSALLRWWATVDTAPVSAWVCWCRWITGISRRPRQPGSLSSSCMRMSRWWSSLWKRAIFR